MPIIDDPMGMPHRRGAIYPAPFNHGFEGRVKRALGDAVGLTQFGVNLTTLEPGAKSALRHWHRAEDEFIYVLSGEVTLITDDGEVVLRASMAAGFPKGDPNGHCLVNTGPVAATYLEVGTRAPEEDVTYPDVDLKGEKRDGRYRFLTRAGEPYP